MDNYYSIDYIAKDDIQTDITLTLGTTIEASPWNGQY